MRRLLFAFATILTVALTGPLTLAAATDPLVDRTRAMYAAFATGNPGVLIDSLAPDVRWEVVGRPSDCACMGVRTGRAAVREFFGLIDSLYEFTQFTPIEFRASGDMVFVLGHYAARNRQTGKSYESDWIHVHTFRDGKIAAFREFLDTAAEAEANRR